MLGKGNFAKVSISDSLAVGEVDNDRFVKIFHNSLMIAILFIVTLAWVGFVMTCFDVAQRSMAIAHQDPGLAAYMIYWSAAALGPLGFIAIIAQFFRK